MRRKQCDSVGLPGQQLPKGMLICVVVEVSIPMYSKFQVVENAYDAQFVPGSHVSVFPYQPGFIMMMTCQRIKLASLSRNVPVRRGQGLGIEHLWDTFYDQMAETMSHLNKHIEARSRPGYIISRIIDLLSVEVSAPMDWCGGKLTRLSWLLWVHRGERIYKASLPLLACTGVSLPC